MRHSTRYAVSLLAVFSLALHAAPPTATAPVAGLPASASPAAWPAAPVQQTPRSRSRPATTSTATGPAPSQASSGLGGSDFSAKGLNFETELTALYLGDFAHARLEPVSVEFDALFGSYLSAFARRCSAYLPATKVEITRSECAREQYTVNGYGVRVGPSTCIEYREVGTGLYADPDLYAAQRRVDAQVARNLMRDTLRSMAGNNPMGSAMRTMDALTSVGSDMDALIEMNSCTSAALKRFQENMRRFALGEPPLRLPGGETMASIRPKTSMAAFKDSDYSRLLDDLIAENSQGWMVNRYVRGSVSAATVMSRDAQGRPARITGNYLFDGLNGRSKGSVALQFADGLPACVYFSDFPTTCRAPSRRIITAYENGRYQR